MSSWAAEETTEVVEPGEGDEARLRARSFRMRDWIGKSRLGYVKK
jgi:hypothetical protein